MDAYNVLHTQGILPPHLAGPEVHELIEMIGASRYKRHRAIVVCDGVPGADERVGGRGVGRWMGANEAVARKPREERRDGDGAVVDVVFAGAGREADEAIEAILESHSAARRMLVVSTDRRVRRAAAKAGAASITSAEFLRDIAADLERHKGAGLSQRPSFATDLPLSRLEVAYWLAHMGMEGEAGGEAAGAREAGPRGSAGNGVEVRPEVGTKEVGTKEVGTKEFGTKEVGTKDGGKKDHGKKDGGKARVVSKELAAKDVGHMPGVRGVEPGVRGGKGEESKAEGANTHAGVPGDGAPSWMHEAARAWAGRLNLEELDTGKWLDSPLAPEPTKDEPTKDEPAKGARVSRGRTPKGGRKKA